MIISLIIYLIACVYAMRQLGEAEAWLVGTLGSIFVLPLGFVINDIIR